MVPSLPTEAKLSKEPKRLPSQGHNEEPQFLFSDGVVSEKAKQEPRFLSTPSSNKVPLALSLGWCYRRPSGASGLSPLFSSKRPPGKGNGCPLQYSCLENSMDREAWWATVWLCIFGKLWGFCGGSDGKESACNAGDLGLISELGRFPGEGHNNLLVFLPRESHGQRSQAGYSPWGHKEPEMTEWLCTT